jgi:hypothetical protein
LMVKVLRWGWISPWMPPLERCDGGGGELMRCGGGKREAAWLSFISRCAYGMVVDNIYGCMNFAKGG